MGPAFVLNLEGGRRIQQSDTTAAELLIMYVPAGEVNLCVHDVKYVMREQDIVAINAGTRYSYESVNDGSFIALLGISAEQAGRLSPDQPYVVLLNSCISPEADYGKIRQIMEMIISRYTLSRNVDLNIEGCCMMLLQELKEQYLVTLADARFRENVSGTDERTMQITSYVESHYNQDISLNDLAAKLHLALSYLSRFTKKALGMTFSDYVNLVRLRHAVADFVQSGRSITRIAMENGFSNITTFNRAFKKHYGVSPSEYRDKIIEQQKENREEKTAVGTPVKEIASGEFQTLHPVGGPQENAVSGTEAEDTGNFRTELINVRKSKEVFRPWSRLVNIGRLSDLKDNRMRAELLRASSELNTEYVRFWNVLSDDMNLGTYRGERVADYDFGLFDSCLDFLIRNHLKPYFHMGYNLPYNIRRFSDTDQEQDYRNNDIGQLFHFRSFDEMIKVLRVVLKHLAERYGEEAVQEFRFSLWYPNLYYRLPDFMLDEDRGAYAVHVYRVIREMFPEVRIGAADFSLLFEKDRVYERIRYLSDHGVDPDFVSFVSYPYRFVLQNGEVVRAWQLQSGFLSEELANFRSVLMQTSWKNKPVWLAEYNYTMEQRNFLNDIRFKGAYIIKNMTDICEQVEGAGYYMLSDVYSEGVDTGKTLFGGCGIISKDSICKPSCFALSFLAKAKKYMIAADQNYLLTTDRRGKYVLIVHNLTYPGFGISMKPERSIRNEDLLHCFDGADRLELALKLDGMEPGAYRFRRQRVDAANGDLASWLQDNDAGNVLDSADITYLQRSCTPELHISSRHTAEDGTLTVECSLEANDFVIFEFSRIQD